MNTKKSLNLHKKANKSYLSMTTILDKICVELAVLQNDKFKQRNVFF